MTRKEVLSINPFIIGKMENLKKEEIEAAVLSIEENYLLEKHEVFHRFINSILIIKDNNYRNYILLIILKENPFLIRFIPDEKQTVKLCELACKEDSRSIEYCKNQSKRLCNNVPENDISTRFRFMQFKNDKIIHRALKGDGRNLQYIPGENQTLELVKIAVDDWAKSIRWAKLSNQIEMEEAQIYAIEKNLQAYTCFIPVSKKVIEHYKELCIKNSYFPDVLEIIQTIEQKYLYQMLLKKYQWIESYTIFNLLNDEYKKRFLETEYAYKINIGKINIPEIKDKELKLRLIAMNAGVPYDILTLNEEEIEYCVKINPDFIHRIVSGEHLTDEFLLKLTKYTTQALKYLKSYKDEYLNLIN